MLNNRLGKRWLLGFIYIIVTCFFLGALSVSIWFSTGSYSSLVNFVTQTLKRPDLQPLIEKSLFTHEKYTLIYRFHWLVYPVITIFSALLYYNVGVIYKCFLLSKLYLRSSFQHVIIFFNNLSRKEICCIGLGCCLFAVLVLYNDHLKDISYDEAWGYNYYINKPFYFPFILFNTYPLYNFLTHFFTFLPFDTVISIRIPSLLFALLTLITLFYTLYKQTGFILTCLALLVLCASPLFYIYSSLSRGITLSLFLAVVVLHVVLVMIGSGGSNKRYRFLYILANFLGVVSMPTFAVYTAANFVFLLVMKRKQEEFVKTLFFDTSIIVCATTVFYLPVLLNSGLSLIYHNNHYAFNIVDTAAKLLSFMFGLSQLFFVSKYVGLLLLAMAIVLLLVKPLMLITTIILRYCIFIVIFTLFGRIAVGNIFPERSLNYLVLHFIILFACLVSVFINRLPKAAKAFAGLLTLVILSLALVHNQKQFLSPVEDKDARVIGELMLKNEIKTAYIDEEEFWFRVPMIEYYYSKENRQVNFATSSKASTRYQPFDIKNNYDCVVSRVSYPNNVNLSYREIYRNNSFVLWKRL